jgi:hypothetical protein
LKKVITYFVLFSFLLSSTGYYFILEISRSVIRSEHQKSVGGKDGRNLIILTGLDCLNEIRPAGENEILYQGCLYDVLYESTLDGNTVLYCSRDVKEEDLVNNFNKFRRDKQIFSLEDHILKILLPGAVTGTVHQFFSIHRFPHHPDLFSSHIILPPTPPPEHLA